MIFNTEINGIPVRAVYSEACVREVLQPLLLRLEALRRQKGGRVLVLLAAPPAAGKSTLSAFLGSLSVPLTVIGMDGFHRRQQELLTHTCVRDGQEIPLVRIKGAPETFDLEKLTEAVCRVAAGESIGWPVYDRLLHDPVDDAVRVTGDIVLLEGNYLLLDAPGWRELRQYADYTISVTAEEPMLRDRLIGRRIATGVERKAAEAFVDFSDMANVRLCLTRTLPADLRLRLTAEGDYVRL